MKSKKLQNIIFEKLKILWFRKTWNEQSLKMSNPFSWISHLLQWNSKRLLTVLLGIALFGIVAWGTPVRWTISTLFKGRNKLALIWFLAQKMSLKSEKIKFPIFWKEDTQYLWIAQKRLIDLGRAQANLFADKLGVHDLICVFQNFWK